MKKIKWAICDDADYFCYIYKTTLEKDNRFEFVGYCLKAADCSALVEREHPDVLLLDIQIETNTAGIDIIPELKQIAPAMKIIILTSYNDENYIFQAFANGADSYLLKDTAKEQAAATIAKVYNNENMLPPEIAHTLANKTRTVETRMKSLLYMFEIMSKLSQSEYEVLKAAYNGISYKDIAASRFVTESTIRNHITRILKKFDSPSMKTLVQNLRELGIFDYLTH